MEFTVAGNSIFHLFPSTYSCIYVLPEGTSTKSDVFFPPPPKRKPSGHQKDPHVDPPVDVDPPPPPAVDPLRDGAPWGAGAGAAGQQRLPGARGPVCFASLRWLPGFGGDIFAFSASGLSWAVR